MHELSFISLLYVNFVMFFLFYLVLSRFRKLVGFQLGMNIAMAAGGTFSLATGILLIFQYPFHFTVITILTSVIGMAAGGIFGALFDYQTMLTGVSNGGIVGIMAPMVGAIVTEQFFFLIGLEVCLVLVILISILSVRRS